MKKIEFQNKAKTVINSLKIEGFTNEEKNSDNKIVTDISEAEVLAVVDKKGNIIAEHSGPKIPIINIVQAAMHTKLRFADPEAITKQLEDEIEKIRARVFKYTGNSTK